MADEFLDPHDRLDGLIAQQEARIAAGFTLLVAQIKDAQSLNRIADLLSRGRLEEALTSALRSSSTLGNLYVQSFINSAQATADFLQNNVREIPFVFDQTNPFSMQAARQNQLRLVNEFTRAQRDATRQAIVNGIQRGANPLEQAREFVDSIGLTRRQVQHVENYRRALESENPRSALSRELRDKRFDRTVSAATRDGRKLTRDQVDRMTERYRERYIRYRSRVIGRTEAMRSVHEGKQAMYRQAIDAGQLDSGNMTQEWNTAMDERVRGSHTSMNQQVVPFDTPFVSGLGNQLRYPTDPAAPPEDSIQCRCAVGTRVVAITAPAGFSVSIG